MSLAIFFEKVAGLVWNLPLVIVCFCSALFFSIRFLFIQLRCFPHAIALLRGKYDNEDEDGHISHFEALTSALSGTIGLGNIAGVSVAIATGGPGSIFWMWIVAFLGMATKFVECTLGTLYRTTCEDGQVRGGPMYYIQKGLGMKWRPMAIFYAIAVSIAGIGTCSMFQSNQAAEALLSIYNVPKLVTGLVFFILGYLVIIGGIKRIGIITSKVVPMMCGIYVLSALYVILMNIELIPSVFSIIISDAFTGKAAAGGAVGTVIGMGFRRAVFSNEAGLGSASIAHAAVKTDYAVREGVVASLGPLIDTIIVCTATACVVLLSGYYGAERYLATGDVISSTSLRSEGNWKLMSDYPKNQSAFQALTTESSQILAYDYKDQKAQNRSEDYLIPLVLESKKEGVTKGIRFSYYPNKGSMNLTLKNRLGEEVAKIPLDNYTQVFDELSDKKGIVLKGYPMKKRWQSLVVIYEGNEGPLTLFLSPSGTKEVMWFFDRMQYIEDRPGILLTIDAFDRFFNGNASKLIAFSVLFFAFSTFVTWCYYGEVAMYSIFGSKAIFPFRVIFVFSALIGALQNMNLIISFSDIMLGLAVLPNMIAIFMLSRVVLSKTEAYFKMLREGKFDS